ncbi:alpha-ketoglutarate decarboxylase [Kordia sp.]|uniref:alpha-ketoglutarate decarboxylase n=1 Tax=Kordia sp. TaxID=1965332 RepID=UPI003D2983C3
MRDSNFFHPKNIVFVIFMCLFSCLCFGQSNVPSQGSDFWRNVRFGGGVGLSFGNNIFSATVAPSAIYDFDAQFAAGVSLSYTYFKDDDFFKSTIVGGSFIGLYNPLREIQLSTEFEYMNVSRDFDDPIFIDDNYWQPAVFFGIGYTTNNITVGVRYNVLHDDDKSIYADALVPFFRVYF